MKEQTTAIVVFVVLLGVPAAIAYNRTAAVAYAKKYYATPNHQCGTYTACTPYSYWGSEACGYSSHGGDCADFVSQCLLAGSHPKLNTGYPCRGYPCGKEEIGARNLGNCLKEVHSWTRVCGKNQAPPFSSGLARGDVLVFHTASCTDTSAHATLVSSVDANAGTVLLASHSSAKFDVSYTWWKGSMPYLEWLHYTGDSTDDTTDYGYCTLQSGTPGICIDTTDCTTDGGTATAGLCPGASNIQCCTSIPCGTDGTCKQTTLCDTASNTIVSGLCPGGDDFKCCQPTSAPPPATLNPYPCTVPGKGTGVCLYTATCTSVGGEYSSGYCPGSADFKCCTGIPCGDGGRCMNSTSCSNGTIVADSWEACLMGDAEFLCCEPKDEIKSCEANGVAGTCIANTTRCNGSTTLTPVADVCQDGFDCCVHPAAPVTPSASADTNTAATKIIGNPKMLLLALFAVIAKQY